MGPARRAGEAAAAGPWRADLVRSAGGGGGGFFGATNNGPFVLPGTYRATLSVDGKEVADDERRGQGRSRTSRSRTPTARCGSTPRRICSSSRARRTKWRRWRRIANAQLQQLQNQTRNQTLAPNVKQSLDGVVKEMEVVRRRLGLGGQGGGGGFGGNTENVRGRIGQLKGAIIGSTSVPTNTQLQQIREVKAALPVVIEQANAVAAKLPALVKEMLGAGAIFPALKPIAK